MGVRYEGSCSPAAPRAAPRSCRLRRGTTPGTMLTIEYRTDPDAVAELLPPPLDPGHRRPGRGGRRSGRTGRAARTAFEELLDPVRAQYMECFVVVRCAYRGEHYSRCVYIWVDTRLRDGARAPPGLPEEARRDLYMTRPVTVGRAGPRLEAGGRFGATCAAYGRRLIEATFTITGPSETAGFVNALPMLHHRVFPAIEGDGSRLAARARDDARLRRRGRPLLPRRRHAPRCSSRRSRSSPGSPRPRSSAATGATVATSWRGGTTLETAPT